jgi:diguanylate cyclase (GGDEF)-like protein
MPDTEPRPAPPDSHDGEPVGTTSLRLVRLRLALALLAVAIIPVAVILPVVRFASDDGGRRQETTAGAVVAGGRVSTALADVGRRLAETAKGAKVTTSKGATALPAATRSAFAAIASDSRVGRVVVADLDGDPLYASDADASVPATWLAALHAAERGAIVALVPDAAGRTVALGTSIGSDRSGKVGGIAIVTVPLASVLDPGTAAEGRTVAVLSPDGEVVATRAGTSSSQIGGQLLGVASEIGTTGSTTAAVPLTAAGFAGWAVEVSEPLLPTDLPLPALALLGGLTVLLIGLATWMARQVLAPAVQIEASRQRLGELYASARDAARLDFLTGLGNHRAFQEELDRQVEAAKRYHTPLALLLIDLDEFKPVNDNLGHAVGDDLLVEMGELIRSIKRTPDTGFRTGGDEFALILPHTNSDGAEELGRRLLTRCLEDRSSGAYRRPISFSGGVTAYPEGASTRVQLYAQADAALYRSKRAGRTTISRFDAERDRELIDEHMRAELRSRLAAIIEGRRLSAVYQPIFHLETNRLLGVEALVRPLRGTGFTGATGLFEAAHVTGQILELDRAALDAVTAGVVDVPADLLLTLNLSPRSFESQDFSAAALLRILASHGIDPNRVILELTERERIADVARVQTAVEACRAAGNRIAADDLGAGNAGLRLLSQIRFDVVKIDLSLVQANARREPVSSVLSSLVDLANRWGALTIAEGIETAAQLETVRAIGVDAAQGFFLARPSSLADALGATMPGDHGGGSLGTVRTVDFAAAVQARRARTEAAAQGA